MDRQEIKNLKKRYLIWLYKTARESLDKIERKFTQLEIDKFILKELNKLNRHKKVDKFIADFKDYIQNKEKEGLSLKYKDKNLRPEYLFLVLKLQAIEKAIRKELGTKAVIEIKAMYEREMTERILRSQEHK